MLAILTVSAHVSQSDGVTCGREQCFKVWVLLHGLWLVGADESCIGALQTLQLFAPPFCSSAQGLRGDGSIHLHCHSYTACNIKLLMKVDPRYYHTFEVEQLKSR